MRRFHTTGLWEMARSAGNPTPEITARYDALLDEFVAVLHNYCRDETNIAERTRTLHLARSELLSHIEGPVGKTKKNAPLLNVIRQAVSFIEGEIGIINMELEHPDRFIVFPSDTPPLARWGGKITDLIEYIIGPQAAGIIQKPDGQPMNLEETIKFLEQIFGITIPNPHDRRGKVLDRQKNTTFQDEMRRVFLEEAKKRNK